MPAFVTEQRARNLPARGGGYERNILDYTLSGIDPADPAAPQAFLVQLRSAGTIRPHFHTSNQFQVFLTGSGTLGRKTELSPVTVHYTDSFTPYGPITFPGRKLDYLTLRDVRGSGPQYMPESRDRLTGRPGRNRTARIPHAWYENDTGATSQVVLDEPDGLSVSFLRGDAGEEIDAGSGGARYWIVLGGSVHCGQVTLSEHELLYLAPGEALRARAGADGAGVLCVQFGQPAEAGPSADE